MTSQPVYRLAVVVETTSSQGRSWPASRECIEKCIRALATCAQNGLYDVGALQLALILYGTDEPSSAYSVQSSGWTSDVKEFRQWADGIRFEGGGAKQVRRSPFMFAEHLPSFIVSMMSCWGVARAPTWQHDPGLHPYNSVDSCSMVYYHISGNLIHKCSLFPTGSNISLQAGTAAKLLCASLATLLAPL